MNVQRRSLARVMRCCPSAVALAAGLFTLAACGSSGQSTPPPPPAPVVRLPGSVPFGPVPEGATSTAMTVILMNVGTESLIFTSSPAITGTNEADFAITGATCSTASPLITNASCTVTVTFKPSTTSAETAALGFADNATPGSQSVSLTGTGTAPAPVVNLPASIPFGGVTPVGTPSGTGTATLINMGSATLTFTSAPAVTGANAADFAIASNTCLVANPVPVTGSCAVGVVFTPSTGGAESASLKFTDNAANSPQSVSLTGTGGEPVVSLPMSLPFGSVTQGVTSPSMTVTLMNSGNLPLTFNSPPAVAGADAADFNMIANTCTVPSPVAADGSCTVTLTFTPSTLAMESASLNFADNAANSPQSVSLTGTGTGAPNNVLPVQVTLGPPGVEDVDILFASVTICVSGSTTDCQTIDNIEVDTGSEGLRVLASQLNIALPQATLGGQALGNCVQFVDLSYAWGPVQTGDIVMAGEKAASQPIQVIAEPGFASVPTGANGCAVSGGTDLDTVVAFGANGIIGVGPFRQDCGPACAQEARPGTYYTCPNNSCSPTTIPLASQLQNPVWMFPQDNNGVLVSLPSVAANGALTVDGSLIFGIGTQANNVLGTAQVYTTDDVGNFTATYKNVAYADSFVDSGSNGLFFLNTSQSGLTACPMSSNFYGFYCSSGGPFTVTNKGANGVSGQVSFSIVNATTLFNNNPNAAAFSNLGGPFSNTFDYGLAFFFGRNVFTGIEGQQTGTVTGPFF